jgi:hypothetical protein
MSPEGIQPWTVPLYFFISVYAVIQYLLGVRLFPEEQADDKQLQGAFLFPPTMDFKLDDDSVYGGSCQHFHQMFCLCTFIGFVLLPTDDSLCLAERSNNKDQGRMASRGLCDNCDSR